MNAIMIRRNRIIDQIMTTLNTIKEKGLTENTDEFLWQICEEHGCAIRKAKEYMRVAREKIVKA